MERHPWILPALQIAKSFLLFGSLLLILLRSRSLPNRSLLVLWCLTVVGSGALQWTAVLLQARNVITFRASVLFVEPVAWLAGSAGTLALALFILGLPPGSPLRDRPWRRLFTFHGRDTRRHFWIARALVAWLTLSVLIALLSLSTRMEGVRAIHLDGPLSDTWSDLLPWHAAVGFTLLAALAIGLASYVRRLHDRARTGAWYLVSLVPVIGPLWLLIECGFLKSIDNANPFPSDSSARSPTHPAAPSAVHP